MSLIVIIHPDDHVSSDYINPSNKSNHFSDKIIVKSQDFGNVDADPIQPSVIWVLHEE